MSHRILGAMNRSSASQLPNTLNAGVDAEGVDVRQVGLMDAYETQMITDPGQVDLRALANATEVVVAVRIARSLDEA